jgi:membrane protein YqaA with SNARE-associated domain
MAEAPEHPPPDPVGLRNLLLKLVGGVIALIAGLLVVGYLWRQQLLGLGQWFVENLGGPGIAITFLVPDAVAVPVPQDAIMALALFGGLKFWTVVAWATAGSLLGGSAGLLLGRLLGHTAWYRRMAARGGFDGTYLVRRYGHIALAVGALTPVPYSIVCWASGAFGVRYLPFLSISLLRFVRVSGYLWLVDIGVVQILQ